MIKRNSDFRITDSQWLVLTILWEKSIPQSVSQIRDALESKGITWKNNTIHTFLTRLEESGFVSYQNQNPKLFYPLITKEECQKKECRNFLDKVYHGSVKTMISTFLSDGTLTKDEIDEIKQLLNDD